MARRDELQFTDADGARQFLADVVESPEERTFSDVLAALTLLYRAGELHKS
jgi:hypothetical protein